MKYTYSDDEDAYDSFSTRRSNRDSGISTPFESVGPTITASGRLVKSRTGGIYGEIRTDQKREITAEIATNAGDATETSEDMPTTMGRKQRSGRISRPARRLEAQSNETGSDEESEAASSEKEWSGNEDEPDESEPDFEGEDEDEEMSGDVSVIDDADDDENTQESLVVQLRYKKGGDMVASKDRPSLRQMNHQESVVRAGNDEPPHSAVQTNDMSGPQSPAAPHVNGSNGVGEVYMQQCQPISMDSVDVY
jgi:hypothetical protein